jgi:hypothetical protein
MMHLIPKNKQISSKPEIECRNLHSTGTRVKSKIIRKAHILYQTECNPALLA